MASGKTDTLENEIINHYLRGVATNGPYTAWLALYSVAPTDSTAGTELTGNGYGRIAVALDAPSAGVATNGGTITFTASGGAWSAIVGHSLMSVETAGATLYFEDSVSGPTLADGDSYQFDAADVTVTET